MNNKLVSILIPVYNREKIISYTIESALKQTYKDVEIIIVDNNSEDNTYNICKEFERIDSRVKVYRNSENIGPVKNWLKCVQKSNGEYLKFLWSDDWIDVNYIEKTIPYLSDESIAFVYSSADIVYDDMKTTSYKLYEEDTVFNASVFEDLSLFGGDVPVSPGCAVYRKKDIMKNLMVELPNRDGLIFNRFGAGNDLLIFLLPLMDYGKVAFVSSTKSYFRAHKDSFSIGNDLDIYYDWARQYYLEKKDQTELLKKFKTVLLVKMIRNKAYINLYKSNKNDINIKFLGSITFKKMMRKFKNI